MDGSVAMTVDLSGSEILQKVRGRKEIRDDMNDIPIFLEMLTKLKMWTYHVGLKEAESHVEYVTHQYTKSNMCSSFRFLSHLST